jgi:hypothetical protein
VALWLRKALRRSFLRVCLPLMAVSPQAQVTARRSAGPARKGVFRGIEKQATPDSEMGCGGKFLLWNRYFSIDMPFGYS